MQESFYNTSAEASVLGAIFCDNEAIEKTQLKAEDFYHEANKVIFSAMTELFEKGERIEPITMMEILRKQGKLEAVGGIQALLQLDNSVPTSAGIVSHAKIVRNKSLLRKIAFLTAKAREMCEHGDEPLDISDKLQKDIAELGKECEETVGYTMADILLENRDILQAKIQNPNYGTKTGFKDLDRMLGGLQPSNLVIVAGRPAMGKTAFGLNIVANASKIASKRCLVFSLEMSRTELLNRLASLVGGLEGGKLAQPTQMTHEDWQKYKKAAEILKKMPIRIIDRGKITPMAIRRYAKSMKNSEGLDLIMVDYLGLLHSDRQRENKVVEVADMTRDLKELAKELNVPIILLCQLNRGNTSRTDKRPMMSDLRDSGSIEQDADVVLLLHREEYYNPDTELKNVAEVIISKHRNGETGTVNLFFQGSHMAFKNLSRDDYVKAARANRQDEDEDDDDED